ncbi:hypothetical protein LCGC14_1608430 [marine sediment metagenome]|uniref:Uncharacterized protein n=1 Tax=marine sediment metagenome TaxID=412755 RepID=A0A0F9IVP6_9ZZZZ
MIEFIIGLAFFAFLLSLFFLIGHAMAKLKDGWWCIDAFEAIGNGFCWCVGTVAISSILYWIGWILLNAAF